MNEESEKALRHRAEQLNTLAAVEAFAVLRAECAKTAERIGTQLKDLLLLPGPQEHVNQRQVDYNRGFVAGMKYATTDVPSGAARTLQRLEQGAKEPPEPEEDYWSYEQQPE